MDPFNQAISKIIKEQEEIIGPIALDQANKVNGLEVDNINDIQIKGNKKDILNSLVNQYSKLFGKASIEVCKDSIKPYSNKIPASDIPDILKS